MENVIASEIQKLENAEAIKVEESTQELQATNEIPAPVIREKLKDKQEIVIESRSPLMPGAVVFLGTGDLNKKYFNYLENTMKHCMSSGNKLMPGKVSKNAVNNWRFMNVLCSLAVIEDETTTVTYSYKGPVIRKGLDTAKVVKDFILKHGSFLYMLSPYYGVKNNRMTSVHLPQVENPAPMLPEAITNEVQEGENNGTT